MRVLMRKIYKSVSPLKRMTKKRVTKRASPRKSTRTGASTSSRVTQKLLIENFASLQKVMTHVAGKFDELSGQISELLKLFEDSAKVIVKNEMEKSKENNDDKQILNTMVSILDQNKVIAKGLTLMYETMNNSGSVNSSSESPVKISPAPKKIKIKEDSSFAPSLNTASSPDYFRRE